MLFYLEYIYIYIYKLNNKLCIYKYNVYKNNKITYFNTLT